jgi:iron(III) transport system permease protein
MPSLRLHPFGLAISLACVGLAILILGVTADETARKLLANTLVLCGGVAAVSLPAGLLLAVLLSQTNVAGKRAANLALITMLFLPLHATAAGWVSVFGKFGAQSPAFFQTSEPLVTGMPAVVWIHAMAAIPWATLIIGLGLASIPRESSEAALLDASPVRVLWSLGLRYTLPFIAAAGLLVMIGAAGEMTVTNLYMVSTYAEEIYNSVALLRSQTEVAAKALPGIGTTALLVAAACILISLTLPAGTARQRGPARIFALGRWRWPATALLWLMILLVAGVPIASLVYKAGFGVTMSSGSVVHSWSGQAFLSVILQTPYKYREELGYSFLIAALAATLAFLAALPLALAARRGGAWSWPAVLAAALSWALPGPIVGLCVIWLFNWNFAALDFLYSKTPLAPALAVAVKGLPVMILILWGAFASIPDQILEAARLDGADWREIFCRIILPLRAPTMAAAWLAGFAVGLGDLAWSILVIPPGPETLQRRIFGWIHAGVDDQVAGATLVTLLIYGVLAAAIQGLLRTPRKSKPT